MEMNTVLFWFRRDLRLEDNHGLYEALKSGYKVQPIFIFDRAILEHLSPIDRRVSIIYNELQHLQKELKRFNASIDVRHGDFLDVFKQLVTEYKPSAVYCNEDYEPYAIERDRKVKEYLKGCGVKFMSFLDQVIFRPGEVLKPDGNPYAVFTPYSKRWLATFWSKGISNYPSQDMLHKLNRKMLELPGLKQVGFVRTSVEYCKTLPSIELLRQYHKNRDIPALVGTSRLSVALRFGLISIRKLVLLVQSFPVYLNELIWREFYMMVLFHHPHVVTRSYKAKYDNIKWLNNELEFELWKTGQTGFPIVDAGMRQLNETGYMHNRVRMITASFLTKHLLIDWRWGEAYFAANLNDYELASNNGGWQWAAGSGCDAAPYFRVFNPYEQARKFDPKHLYIKKWVSEYSTFDYAHPIVDHKFARERALKTYKNALNT